MEERATHTGEEEGIRRQELTLNPLWLLNVSISPAYKGLISRDLDRPLDVLAHHILVFQLISLSFRTLSYAIKKKTKNKMNLAQQT